MALLKNSVRLLRSRGAAALHDLLSMSAAWLGAFWLRFNLEFVPEPYLDTALLLTPVVLILQSSVNWRFGLYRGVWRFASIPDVIQIGKAVLTGGVLIALVAFVSLRAEGLPRSVPFLYAMLLFAFLAGDRLIYRILKDRRLTQLIDTRVLIVGCGAAGELLVRDLRRSGGMGYHAVGFVDDNPRRHGQEIHGVRVHGSVADLEEIAEEIRAELIIIAIANLSASQMRRIVSVCEDSGLPFRIIPGLNELVSGDVSVAALREVRIEDLLGREPVQLDLATLSSTITGKSILVTGGGGSIGTELCRQIARLGPSRLIIAEHSEFNLYRISEELKARARNLELKPCLVNVADAQAFLHLCEQTQPQIIFHAAAYKHVPLLETQAHQALINNVGGTLSVSQAAEAVGCERLVIISTDKAVRPTNVMGRSKRLAELMACARGKVSSVPHTIVRFGNVLDSAGSVVPLFREQIAHGGPITLTHRDISRYFMTIPEATQLIIAACAQGDGGDVFVLDMGEPVSIRFLAEQMIKLSGKRVGEDIQIEVTGLRPGEKLYEELFYAAESPKPTQHPRIMRADSSSMIVDFDRALALLAAAEAGAEHDGLVAELIALVQQAPANTSDRVEEEQASLDVPLGAASAAQAGEKGADIIDMRRS